jgi:hypothetical protein
MTFLRNHKDIIAAMDFFVIAPADYPLQRHYEPLGTVGDSTTT